MAPGGLLWVRGGGLPGLPQLGDREGESGTLLGLVPGSGDRAMEEGVPVGGPHSSTF